MQVLSVGDVLMKFTDIMLHGVTTFMWISLDHDSRINRFLFFVEVTTNNSIELLLLSRVLYARSLSRANDELKSF